MNGICKYVHFEVLTSMSFFKIFSSLFITRLASYSLVNFLRIAFPLGFRISIRSTRSSVGLQRVSKSSKLSCIHLPDPLPQLLPDLPLSNDWESDSQLVGKILLLAR
jgi:hypothetical protein